MQNKIIRQFYAILTDKPVNEVTEVPVSAMAILDTMGEKYILKLLIAYDLRRGLSRRMLANKYNVKPSTVQSVKRAYKL